jgi:hypothetical protein
MNVDVLALLDVGDGLADVVAVFDDRVALLDVIKRNLVSDGHVHLRLQLEGGIVGRDDAQHVGARGQSFDHDNAHRVFCIVNQQLRHCHAIPHFPKCDCGMVLKTSRKRVNAILCLILRSPFALPFETLHSSG